jgi:uncharacterized surface protein with fasciclin (FAS1) repeats
MRLRANAIAAAMLVTTLAGGQAQEKTVMVGGVAMYPSKDIIDNALNSKDHTTLVAAVKAAGLVDTLKGTGPFTVFAPTNAAFEKLPEGTVEMLLKAENKDKLKTILTYHVVAGKLDATALKERVAAGGGKAQLMTVSGDTLWVIASGKRLQLRDETGHMVLISTPDVYQSNGVIHVINAVVMPK